MSEELRLFFNDEGKAQVSNEDYTIYCADEKTFEKVKEAVEKKKPKFVECPKGFQGMRDTRYYCPNCHLLTRQHEKFCHNCGQAVKYPKEVYNKAKNQITLDWSNT